MPHLSTNYCTNGSYVIFIVNIMLKIFDLKNPPKTSGRLRAYIVDEGRSSAQRKKERKKERRGCYNGEQSGERV